VAFYAAVLGREPHEQTRDIHVAFHLPRLRLADRGLDKDVAVVVWGEMGRTPRINNPGARGLNNKPGRDHWCNAGFALMAGGGWRMGQVIGRTNAWAAAPVGRPYTPQNVLATIYRHLGLIPRRP
jgi:hypothetical protein